MAVVRVFAIGGIDFHDERSTWRHHLRGRPLGRLSRDGGRGHWRGSVVELALVMLGKPRSWYHQRNLQSRIGNQATFQWAVRRGWIGPKAFLHFSTPHVTPVARSMRSYNRRCWPHKWPCRCLRSDLLCHPFGGWQKEPRSDGSPALDASLCCNHGCVRLCCSNYELKLCSVRLSTTDGSKKRCLEKIPDNRGLCWSMQQFVRLSDSTSWRTRSTILSVEVWPRVSMLTL